MTSFQTPIHPRHVNWAGKAQFGNYLPLFRRDHFPLTIHPQQFTSRPQQLPHRDPSSPWLRMLEIGCEAFLRLLGSLTTE